MGISLPIYDGRMGITNTGWTLHDYGGNYQLSGGMVDVTNIWWACESMVGNRALHVHGGHYQYVVDIIFGRYYMQGRK